ncbi:MAG TPA: GNAT family N-acetyltransferase [Candidatus Magasanikbacteria bacterium]|nr:GNAT family N-acetyltransferase [Candidatus Magasanikbacteria bacterium]
MIEAKVIYRPLTIEDLQSDTLEEVQRQAWVIPDITIVPTHLFQAVCKYEAGLVIGALVDGELIGFILALATGDRNIQHIHQIGVLPSWQGKMQGKGLGIGYGLFRCYQRVALQKGIKEVNWTFDPLLGQNANLYFHKIAGVANHYEPALYGETSEEGIYGKRPTDRLFVRWQLEESAKRPAWSLEEIRSLPIVSSPDGLDGGIYFRVEIPPDVKGMTDEDACESMLRVREIFTAAFEQGYQIVDFLHVRDGEGSRNFYLFG